MNITTSGLEWRDPTPGEHLHPRPGGPFWRVIDVPPHRQVREYTGVRDSRYAVLELVCPGCRRVECTCSPRVADDGTEWSLIVDSIETADEAIEFARTWRREEMDRR